MAGGGGISGRRRPAGSGGGTGSGGIGGGNANDPCANIDEFTDLLSPKADVLDTLKRGEILRLSLSETGEPPIAARTADGKIAGSVVPLALEILIRCLKRGRKFQAEVVSKAGGACKVRITIAGD